MVDISQMSDTDLAAIAGGVQMPPAPGANAPTPGFLSTVPDLSTMSDSDLQKIAATPDDPGILSAIGRGLGNAIPGATHFAALGDTATSYVLPSGVQSWISPGKSDQSGEPFSQRYSENLAAERGEDATIAKAHPVISTVAPIAGALAALPVAGPVDAISSGVAGVLPGAGGLAADALASGAVGGGYGAAYGAGNANSVSDLPGDVAAGATTGAVFGAVTPAVVRGLGSIANAGRSLVQGVVDPAGLGTRQAIGSIAADRASGAGVLLPEDSIAQAQEAGQPLVGADYGGQATRRLARTISNKSPEAQAAITGPLEARFADQNTRLPDFVQSLYPSTIDSDAVADALAQKARSTNAPAYAKAYADGANGVWNPDLEGLVNSPNVRTAITGAEKFAANDAVLNGTPVVRNPFVADAQGNFQLGVNPDGSRAVPTLQFWDYVKRGLDDQAGAAFSSGQKTQGAQIVSLKNALLSNLDNAVPSYATARQGAFQAFGADNALDAGKNILKTQSTPGQLQSAVANMTPMQQRVLSYGAASAVADRAANSGDSRNIVNLFNTPAIRAKLQTAMGPGTADQLEAYLRTENAMNVLKNSVRGNSTTAEQATDLLGMAANSLTSPISGAALGAAEGYRESSGEEGGVDPQLILKYGAAGFMAGALKKAYAGQNAKVMEGLADTLASPDPDVYNATIKRMAQNQAAMDALRGVSNGLVGASASRVARPAQGSPPASGQQSPYKEGGRVAARAPRPNEASQLVRRTMSLYGAH